MPGPALRVSAFVAGKYVVAERDDQGADWRVSFL